MYVNRVKHFIALSNSNTDIDTDDNKTHQIPLKIHKYRNMSKKNMPAFFRSWWPRN